MRWIRVQRIWPSKSSKARVIHAPDEDLLHQMLLTQPKVTVTQAPYPLWWGMDEEGLPEKWRQQGNALFGENDFQVCGGRGGTCHYKLVMFVIVVLQGAIGKYDEAIALLRRDRARPRFVTGEGAGRMSQVTYSWFASDTAGGPYRLQKMPSWSSA